MVLESVRQAAESADAPQHDPLARECTFHLMATQLAVRSLFDALFARYGLSAGTFNVLLLLRSEPGPLQPHQVAERLGVTRPTVTGLLGTLGRRGYLDRRTHPNDRRMVLLSIAPEGEAALARLLPEIAALEQQAFAPLPDLERRTLMATLTRVRDHAERLAATPASV